mmetsp:Transcript_13319/g.19104  ORF Transcript_13319/g.19104 Transcript_13319/m.19104 type:complete len:93 (+) Transcript_13319:426-704(+)|eukprot:scaffold89146_cov32-Tisochrysis_lutea.AAC.2
MLMIFACDALLEPALNGVRVDRVSASHIQSATYGCHVCLLRRHVSMLVAIMLGPMLPCCACTSARRCALFRACWKEYNLLTFVRRAGIPGTL